MPPTTTAPTRKRSSQPYDTSQRPRPSSSTSTSGPAAVNGDKKAVASSSKPRHASKDSAVLSAKALKADESKLQRIRSNESLTRRDDDGEYKKNRKKKRKVSVIASSVPIDAEPEKRSLENRQSDPITSSEKPITPKPGVIHPPSSPGSKPMMHTAMDQHMKALNRKNAEIERLQLELAAAKDEAGRIERDMKDRLRVLEKENEEHREEKDGKDKKLEEHRIAQEALAEACQCGVCMDTLDDPHTLSCGHIACKKCLISWFRTPGAYPSPVPSPIPADLDLSYWRKSCHVCRAIVIHRPTRLFLLGDILGPLGIDPHLPSASQQAAADPWERIFPVEKSTYRIEDASDHCQRCPNCGFEIADSMCQGCEAEFSTNEDEFDGQDFDLDDDLTIDEEIDDRFQGANGGAYERMQMFGIEPQIPILEEVSEDDGSDDDESQWSRDEDGSAIDSDLREEERDDLTEEARQARGRQRQIGEDMFYGQYRTGPTSRVLRAHRDRVLLNLDNDEASRNDEEDEEDGYEDSFIDDESDGARAGYDGSSESDDSSGSGSGDSEDDSEDEDSDSTGTSDVMELARTAVEDMRQRRAGRAAPAPAPARRVVSNEHAAVRRPPARRPRAIVIDSDDD